MWNIAFLFAFLLAVTAHADTLIVLNKSEATASLIDLSKGNIASTLPTGEGPHEVALTSDGRLALVTNYGTRDAPGSSMTLIDIPSATVVRTIQLEGYHRPHGVLWLKDNRRALVTVEEQKALLMVDTEQGQVVKAVKTGQDVSHMVSITPDEKRAFVANIGSGSISVVDVQNFTLLKTIQTGEGAEGITVTVDGEEVWVTNREADTISVVDASALRVIQTISSRSFPIRAQKSSDGKYILVSHATSGQLAAFDCASKKEVARITFTAENVGDKGRLFGEQSGPVPIGIAMHPSGKTAYVAMSNADRVAVIDTNVWKVQKTLPTGKEPDGIGYSKLSVTEKK
jgi:YVTN family beta-propeller protein